MLNMKTAWLDFCLPACPWLSMFFWYVLSPFSDQVAFVSLCSLKCCSVCCFIACSRHHLPVSFTDSFTLTCSRNTWLECTPSSFWAVRGKHFAAHVMNWRMHCQLDNRSPSSKGDLNSEENFCYCLPNYLAITFITSSLVWTQISKPCHLLCDWRTCFCVEGVPGDALFS